MDLIRARTSTRTFDGREPEIGAIKELEDFLEDLNQRQDAAGLFRIFRCNKPDSGQGFKLGTYGVISGATAFVAGIVDKNKIDALRFGCQFEEIVLKATDLDLGTCWLGGTFNKSELARNLSLADHETIPIISPLGHARGKRKFIEIAMRKAAGSDQRKPWDQLFFAANGKTPLSKAMSGNLAVPLEMVRLGPSASNKQPWRIVMKEDGCHFYINRSKGYGIPGFDIQMNDIGIAICHFEQTALAIGLDGKWQIKYEVESLNDWQYVISWIQSGES